MHETASVLAKNPFLRGEDFNTGYVAVGVVVNGNILIQSLGGHGSALHLNIEGIGLGIVFLVHMGAKVLGLVTLLNLLSWLLSSIILIVIVVFQNDIRRALIRMGGKAWFSGGREQQSRVIDEVVAAARLRDRQQQLILQS